MSSLDHALLKFGEEVTGGDTYTTHPEIEEVEEHLTKVGDLLRSAFAC